MTKSQNPFNHVLDFPNQVLWLLLAFHAGYLNAGGFLATQRFVSHMTGIGTSIGLSFGMKDYLIALELIFAPVSFILGAGFAGYLMDRNLVRHQEPKVTNGVLVIICLNGLVFLGGVLGVFGEFGEALVLQRDFALLFTLCFTCGLQNGLFVTVTSGQIRTTHITGLSTDVGLNLVKILSLKHWTGRRNEVRKNNLRIKKIIAFSCGSFVSAIIFHRLHYWGFFISTVISLLIFLLTVRISSDRSREDRPIEVG